MARETITTYTSDVSGKPIPDGKAIEVRVRFLDDDRPAKVFDAIEGEIEVPEKAREDARKGRPPKK